MQKRHEDQLGLRLDTLYITGITSITWQELYLWYGVDKIRKAPYRDIQDRWERLLEENGIENTSDLQAVVLPDRISFFYAEETTTLTELAK